MTWLVVLTSIPALLKMILELVKQFEVPGVTGAEKKNSVIAVISAALAVLPKLGIQVPTAVILTVVDSLIDSIVLVYNNLGIFKHEKSTS
jgi:hypothetical protein